MFLFAAVKTRAARKLTVLCPLGKKESTCPNSLTGRCLPPPKLFLSNSCLSVVESENAEEKPRPRVYLISAIVVLPSMMSTHA